jgi:hypothetical protein
VEDGEPDKTRSTLPRSTAGWRKHDRLRRSAPAGYKVLVFYAAACAAATLVCILGLAVGLSPGRAIAVWLGCITVFVTISHIWESKIAVRRVREQLALGNTRRAGWAARVSFRISNDSLAGAQELLACEEGKAPPQPAWPHVFALLSVGISIPACGLAGIPLARAILLCLTVSAGVGAVLFDLMRWLIRRRIRKLLTDGHVESARAFARRAEVDWVVDLGLVALFGESGRIYVPLFDGIPARPWASPTSFVMGVSGLLLPLDPVTAAVALILVHLLTTGLQRKLTITAVREALTKLERRGEDELAAALEKSTKARADIEAEE